MSYTSSYAELVRRHLGREPKASDGLPDAEMREAEKRLGLQLPISLRDYYRTAGNLSELNEAHNLLLGPHSLFVEEGFLVFMEENQSVVRWGLKMSELSASQDPEVWQRVNSDRAEWYSEEMSFSEFIIRMFDWQAGLERADPA